MNSDAHEYQYDYEYADVYIYSTCVLIESLLSNPRGRAVSRGYIAHGRPQPMLRSPHESTRSSDTEHKHDCTDSSECSTADGTTERSVHGGG